MSEDRRATFLCKHPNGLTLRLFEQHHGDALRQAPMPIGEPVVIAGPPPGQEGFVATEVDAAFLAAWFEQNELNPLVVAGAIQRA